MNLFCFGIGYCAKTFVRRHGADLGRISGTVRTPDKAARLGGLGIEALLHAGGQPGPRTLDALARADAVLVSAAPDEAGDPMLRDLGPVVAAGGRLRLVIYLSTVGVYGDHRGAWIDETTPAKAVNPRGLRRLEAEAAWMELGRQAGFTVQSHRLAGIYGPGRNALIDLREGKARRVVKPGQVFNRIHVDDIAGAIAAGLRHPDTGGAFNVCDDEPGPPQDVVAFAAGLLGVEPPPEIAFADAAFSEMARSFYSENKRCRNECAKRDLGWMPQFPTYREGLRDLLMRDPALT